MAGRNSQSALISKEEVLDESELFTTKTAAQTSATTVATFSASDEAEPTASGTRSNSSALCGLNRIDDEGAGALQNINGGSRRANFSVSCDTDQQIPQVFDVALLPSDLVVVSDFNNECVKLFDLQGEIIYMERMTRGPPEHLAVIDPDSRDTWRFAVSLDGIKAIGMLDVTSHSIEPRGFVRTPAECKALAAVNNTTIAVGYGYKDQAGIDLLDLFGNVLRRLDESIKLRYMSATPDGFLLVTTDYKSLVKINIASGAIVFNQEVPPLEGLNGVAALPDGSCVVTTRYYRSVDLVTPDGHWSAQLWRHPDGGHYHDRLWSVSVARGLCVTCTKNGSLFVLEGLL